MSDLVTILNSGESLEKTLVLLRLAYQRNGAFYQGFPSVRAFHGENLPKKAGGIPVHGTLAALVRYLGHRPEVRYTSLDDLWDDRDWVLTRLLAGGRITERVSGKLGTDRQRYDRIVPHFPWCNLLESLASHLRERVARECGNSTVEPLLVRDNLELLHGALPHIGLQAKLYTLHPDGGVSSRCFGRRLSRWPRALYDTARRSIVSSPNVYLFLMAMQHEVTRARGDATFGFRLFQSRPRRSYDAAIGYLRSGNFNTVMEPRNEGFGEVLDAIDREQGAIPAEHKLNLAIYSCLERLL